jgi:hypothetical protein
MDLKMTLQGMDDVQKQLERIERGSQQMAQNAAVVYSRLPYGYGQEYGEHRVSRKLARKGGPAHYLTRAKDEMSQSADTDIAEGLTKVTAPGVWVLRRMGRWARRLARLYVPRRSGKLRRSIRATVGRIR